MSDALPNLFGSRTAADSAPRPLRSSRPGAYSPFVTRLSVDGFGTLAGLELPELSPGLNVVLGRNEAGKSTLFDFITGVLFGFPRLKADERFHPPVNGGRHGGRIGIVDSSGRTLVVERHGAPQKELRVTLDDGSAGDEADLVRLLGGANRDLFRTVFAVDLDDLRRIDGLASDQVREVLFASSVVGQRRSASAALAGLEARRDALVRPRQGGRANQLNAQLRDARRALADARSLSAKYERLAAQAASTGRELEVIHEALETSRSEHRDLELLQRCWEAVLRRHSAERDLAELGPESEEDRVLLATEPAVRELRVGLSGHTERLQSRAEALSNHLRLVQSVDDRVARLGAWSTAAADDASLDLPAIRRELESHAEAVTKADGVCGAARAALERARAEEEVVTAGAETNGGEAVPSREALSERLRQLRQLRVLVSAALDLERDIERDLDRAHARSALPAPGASQSLKFGLIAAVAAAFVAVTAALVLVASGKSTEGAVLGAAALLVLAFFGVALLRDRSRAASLTSPHAPANSGSVDPAAERPEKLARLRGQIAATAARVACPEPVVSSEVQRLIEDIETLLETRRALDDRERLARQHSERVRKASADAEAAMRSLTAARAAVAAAADAWGLPPGDDARRLLEVVAELAELRERRKGIRRIEADSGTSDVEIRAFEARLTDLARSLVIVLERSQRDEPIGLGAIEGFLSDIEARLADALHRRALRLDLERDLAAADDELDRQLGRGDRAEALRAALASGRVLDWQADAESVSDRIEVLERRHTDLVREHQSMLIELDRILHSDEIAMLEARCEELEAELEGVMREFLVVSAARLLVSRTLREHERERQPAVVARASELFAQVTGGRYARVTVSADGDGTSPSVNVLSPNGSPIDAAVLSRGTIEQLYLCLRLALAESFAERHVPLPIVLDDVLVNFDPERTEAVAATIAATAEHHQVIAFTCHPHVAELLGAQPVASGASVIELSS